jgi:hypothetical protein
MSGGSPEVQEEFVYEKTAVGFLIFFMRSASARSGNQHTTKQEKAAVVQNGGKVVFHF